MSTFTKLACGMLIIAIVSLPMDIILSIFIAVFNVKILSQIFSFLEMLNILEISFIWIHKFHKYSMYK